MELYDIDYTYSSAVIADLQSKGKKVMCYISAGTSENFRDDFNLFAEEAQGSIVSFAEGDVVRSVGYRKRRGVFFCHQREQARRL